MTLPLITPVCCSMLLKCRTKINAGANETKVSVCFNTVAPVNVVTAVPAVWNGGEGSVNG